MGNGLTERDIAAIFGILEKHPDITLVYLFGSRAKGVCKPGSDVDLAIMNPGVSQDTMCSIQGEFQESSLPYIIDVVNYPDVKHRALKEHIEKDGVKFYSAPARSNPS